MTDLTLIDGLRLLHNKRYQDVHAGSIELIKKDVHNPLPYFLLGIIAEEHKNYGKAPELFAKAAELGSDVAHFHIYHAKILSTVGQQNAAKASADKAAALDIDDASLADTIGVVYSRAGFHKLAIPFFEKAVSIDPDQANYHFNLAASTQFIGDFSTAKQAYETTIKLDDRHYRAWSSLTSLEKQTEGNNQLLKLIELFDEAEQDAEGRLQIGHAIAKTLEDIERYGDSLDWLLKAKTAKREQLRYDGENGRELFEAAKQTFDLGSKVAANAATDSPIFIVGLPRTGTTLVDRILSSHVKVVSAGELNFFAELIKTAVDSSSNMVMDAHTLQRARTLDLSEIGESYIQNSLERADGSKYMVDKMPLNFFYAGLIHRALPNARIISLRRGAMDSCLSNFRQLFSTRYSYYNYTFDLEDTAEFYRLYDDLMSHWRNVLPAERFMEIRYEDIVFDQKDQTRKLLDFCGLEWDEACMHFHENAAPVSTASSVQVRQPLYSGSIDRWKKYGDKLDVLKTALGELAEF